uniref:Uncharacterized protein AlNc14C284G10155 n=1 Tax=Albugo laibachii Nc14 TaxID=890382 RepID=F0WV10_9STRA|nr:conserved hypothetical protein [Albugo laibachii Nc14]|eukprot:CCA25246.1 conserved hypothetical protein [Albugo laibachii Nc14]
MKRGLFIRNVSSHDVPLDSLDYACLQTFSANGFTAQLAVLDETEILKQLIAPQSRSDASSSVSFINPFEPSVPPQLRSEHVPYDAVLFRASGLETVSIISILKLIRTISRQIFVCVMSAQLVEDAMGRYVCFQNGVSMVTNSLEDIHKVMRFVAAGGQGSRDGRHRQGEDNRNQIRSEEFNNDDTNDWVGRNHYGRSNRHRQSLYRCPFCDKAGFNEDQLWRHCPLYHINEPNREKMLCPICLQSPRGPFQVHLHNAHGPPGRGESVSEFDARESVLYAFALVVCHNRKYNRFLLVQEFANSGYWLPGGRVDGGEKPLEAAIRETKEEAGIDIRITGLLKMEYNPKSDRGGGQYVRMRFVFYAEPVDSDQLPKSIPDYESVGATWVQADEVQSLPLRGPEPTIYFPYVAAGQPIYPLDVISGSASSFVGSDTLRRM